MLGNLTLEALIHGPIETIAQVTEVAIGVGFIGFLIYTKRVKWLWKEWLTSLDHKKIGIMYIVVAIVMLLRGFIDAVMMRTQQAISVGDSHGFLTAGHFDQLFTAHGVIMIFFVATPLVFGLINFVLPLQIGSRDVAFPFLNSLSLWLFVAAAMLVNISLSVGQFAETGWLGYPPLTELAFNPGEGIDYYIWSLQLSGIGTLLAAINILVTILKERCPGMTLMRMPIFAWATLGSMMLIIVVFPILTAALAMLSLDRILGMHFFTADFGGNAMMYVNLVWAWGHPEVYILILPAFGIFSEIVATFSRKRLFGYTSMVVAIMIITILSFMVWLHHFFTMGAGADVNAVFGIATMIIAIPTGVKVFNWLFTMYRGRVQFSAAMHWFVGFVITFVSGGMTGVLMAVPGADFQIHNTLFLVAHFHTMVIGGAVFGYLAGITYWFPKIAGFTLNEQLGKYSFWSWIVGFIVAFIPLYFLGLMGMTRRLDNYDAASGWQPLLIVAAVGVLIIFVGVLFQVAQAYVSFRDRKKNADTTGDPWDGRTLEWSTASPAPFYNFAVIPRVYSTDAFWHMKHGNTPRPDTTHYEDIVMPRNTGTGFIMAVLSFVIGFAITWHIFWLAWVSFFAIIACAIAYAFDENTEYVVPAAEVARIEAANEHKKRP